MTPVVLPAVDNPTVTIVLVTYGQWDLCRRALDSVLRNTEPVYEVVVVDNASVDGTAARLRDEVRGATVVLNERNHGFGAGANQGAMHARGRHLCFLNSDAFVEPGWLSPMLDVLEADESVGAVVPRFLNTDGTLQDAGHVLDLRGNTYALGYGEDAGRLDFRFRRDLEYGSGACLLVRRRDFTSVGGFDPVYGRGYYEDADLGLALARAGRRVVYEPRSTVVHVQGGSSVYDEATTELVATNRRTFRARWSDDVVTRPSLEQLDHLPHRLVAARDAACLDRVLTIADGEGRTAALATSLARTWPQARVTLLDRHGGPAEALLAAGVEVVEGDGEWRAWLNLRRFHYSVVVFGGAEEHAHAATAVLDTQPQAARLLHVAAEVHRIWPEVVHAMRAAHVVVCGSEADRQLLTTAFPDVPAFVVDGQFHGEGDEMPILSAMSHLGTAPPLCALERRMARR